ncbi:hypothetical protein KUV22_05025 [Microbulbifer agarilyticus]|uniref:hypothetical protein n=1 Tax=Microbulbifer agarilyticus TaxID=260552 RepID=UPI001C94AC30|nr:hypothetical protein [Microbulbifer agarilyticus]MBY6189776.1 hypothetical protein [Microbulbifer agarilyticus]
MNWNNRVTKGEGNLLDNHSISAMRVKPNIKQRFCISVLVLIFLLVVTRTVSADYLSLTGAETAPNIAEFAFEGEHLLLTLEISIDDAHHFWPALKGHENLNRLVAEADKYSNINVRVETENGVHDPVDLRVNAATRSPRYSPFAGKIDPRTGRKLPSMPEDKQVLQVYSRYHLGGADKITVVPPLDHTDFSTATIGFISSHGAMPVSNYAYLSRSVTWQINRQDPWQTQIITPRIQRQLRFPLHSYLYIQPREIRHEIIFRPRDMATWSGNSFDAWLTLDDPLKSQLRTEALAFLQSRNPLAVDQKMIEPQATEVTFLKLTSTGFLPLEDNENIPLGALLMGYRARFPVDGLPQNVEVDWDLFSPFEERVPSLIQDPAGPFPTQLTPSIPTLAWQNFLTSYDEPTVSPVTLDKQRLTLSGKGLGALVAFAVLGVCIFRFRNTRDHVLALATPALGIILSVALAMQSSLAIPLPALASPDSEQFSKIIYSLLNEIPDAYLEQESTEFERSLSQLVSEQALKTTRDALDPIFRPLTITGDRGYVSEISNLRIEALEQTSSGTRQTYRALCTWQTRNEGPFWGHSDRKLLDIRAMLDLEEHERIWKIAAFTPITIRESVEPQKTWRQDTQPANGSTQTGSTANATPRQ